MKKETIHKLNLYHGDCMDFMKSCKDNEFDLAIVDPPYGIGESGDRNKNRGDLAIPKDYKAFAGNDLMPPEPEYFQQLFRVSKNQIIWGANHYITRFVQDSPCWLVWDKVNGATDFADCELAYTSFKTAVRKFAFNWNGMWQGNMKKKQERIHPTQKPIQLYEWLLTNYAEPDQKILDTHLGSGSSAIAAHYFGCGFTGIEIDEDYFNASIKRITEQTRQMDLLAKDA